MGAILGGRLTAVAKRSFFEIMADVAKAAAPMADAVQRMPHIPPSKELRQMQDVGNKVFAAAGLRPAEPQAKVSRKRARTCHKTDQRLAAIHDL
jgi:hypothetical protein